MSETQSQRSRSPSRSRSCSRSRSRSRSQSKSPRCEKRRCCQSYAFCGPKVKGPHVVSVQNLKAHGGECNVDPDNQHTVTFVSIRGRGRVRGSMPDGICDGQVKHVAVIRSAPLEDNQYRLHVPNLVGGTFLFDGDDENVPFDAIPLIPDASLSLVWSAAAHAWVALNRQSPVDLLPGPASP